MIDRGDKVTVDGVKYTVISTYEQTMVQVVDVDGKGKSIPLTKIIHNMMDLLK